MIERRRGTVLAAMADAGIDALVLGREANARYLSGARRLWLAGARPFAPGCVLVRATGAVHLLSASDDGMPPDLPVEHLYAPTWDPTRLMARLAAIPGMADARRVGVDALSPGAEARLTAAFPAAEVVDARPLLFGARARKLPEEVDVIRRAVGIAVAALDAVDEAATPGVRERDLLAILEARMCELGTTVPAFEGTIGHRFPSDVQLVAGDRVVLDAGVLVDGYEGGVARTIVCGSASSTSPADALLDALLSAIEPGTTSDRLWETWDASGAARPTEPMLHGVGIGVEPPIVGRDAATLDDGMVVSLRAEMDGWVRRETVLVTDRGPQLLSRLTTQRR